MTETEDQNLTNDLRETAGEGRRSMRLHVILFFALVLVSALPVLVLSVWVQQSALGPGGTPKYIEYVRDIKKSGEHLAEVINDVLDMSRIEAGQLQPHFSEIEVPEIVNTCMMMISDRARMQKIEITSHLPDNALILHADGRMMKQVLLNLLSNAVKFTPDGGAVSVNVETGIDFGCRITVTDTGIGIEPDMIEAVMEPFVQAETNMERKYEGTGLGLPLVKSMVEMHGGMIGIEGAPGKGTTVIISLPPERVIAPEPYLAVSNSPAQQAPYRSSSERSNSGAPASGRHSAPHAWSAT